jgi:hypothetical protein
MTTFYFYFMKKIIIFIVFLMGCSYKTFSQWHDMNWLIGREANEIMKVNFEGNIPEISTYPCGLRFENSNCVMSDQEGGLMFYTNCMSIYNSQADLIYNGDSLNYNDFSFTYHELGYPIRDGIIALPEPNSENQFYLIHRRVDTSYSIGFKFPDVLITILNMGMNNGDGQVVLKNEPFQFAWQFEATTATKHANGRDWWIVTSEMSNNNYYKLLLTPNGIQDYGYQEIGEKPAFNPPSEGDNLGQNLFSPDGTIYIEHDQRSGTRIFDFDRCTGSLSNFRWIQYPQMINMGAAISPNSRYLYITISEKVYQFDLSVEDIVSSRKTVAEYDGFNPLPPPLLVPFTSMQLAPDGKIYIQGTQHHLHTIHHPNLPGLACDLRQHDIITPETIGVTWPHYPNYRLGPIDGSGCDTLGINNVPLAHYTWEVDTMAPQWIRFTDNSFYEPTEWSWDYGDGFGSTEVNPDHSYATTGIYEVCLTVSNTYGSNTFCRDVEITTVGTDELAIGSSGLQIFPNPANESVTMNCQFPVVNAHYVLEVTDAVGRVWKEVALDGQVSNIVVNTGDFPAGVYYASVKNNGQVLGKGRFVVVK